MNDKTPFLQIDPDQKSGIMLSIVIHAAVLIVLVVQSLVFPANPISIEPTLRVDLVSLPDHLKSELESLENTKKEEGQVQPEAPAKPKEPTVIAKPDTKISKKEADQAKKRAKEALTRLKALQQIKANQENKKNDSTLIKGNKLSAGTSLSADAKEADEASYFDSVRDRLKKNWELPMWLSRLNLSAQVRIFVDSRGYVRNFTFTKPSGNPQFDEQVKLTLKRSQPFPAPPFKLMRSILSDGISLGFPL